MNPATISTSSFVVYRFDGGGRVTGTVYYDEVESTAVFLPSVPLLAATRYAFVLDTSVKDVNGLAMELPFNTDFTTR